MDQERSAGHAVLVDGLRGLLTSFEKILSGLGASPSIVENLKSQLSGVSGSEATQEEAPPVKKEKKIDKVLLLNGNEIDAEVKSEKTAAGRTRNFIHIGRKKVLLAKKGGRWQERAKAQRDFSNYQPSKEDADIILGLSNLIAQGQAPNFMGLADALGKSRGELLGRYRNVSGAGYVEKDGETYVLTEKGREFVNERNPTPAAPVLVKRKSSSRPRKAK